MPFRVPYHLQEPHYRSPYSDSIAQLMLQSGAIEAERTARSGEIWGNAIQQVGGIAAGALQKYGEQKAQEKKAKAVSAFLDSGAFQDPKLALKESIRLFGEKDGVEFARGLYAFQRLGEDAKRGDAEAERMNLGHALRGMELLPEKVRKERWPQIVQKAAPALQQFGVNPEDVAEYDPEKWPTYVDFGRQLRGEKPAAAPEGYTLGPGQKRFQPGGVVEAEVPFKPEAPPQPAKGPDVGSFEDYVIRKYGPQPTAQQITQARREYQQADDKETGLQWAKDPSGQVRLMSSDEIRATGATRPDAPAKPPTGQQQKNLGFFNRAKQADDDLQTVEGEISKMGLVGQAGLEMLPNFLQSEAGQKYRQSQRAFTEARLRLDSGAAIPEGEFENDRKTYFVQPGDKPEVIEQKRRARATVLASIGFQAGPALEGFYGEAAPGMIQTYKERSQRKDATTFNASDSYGYPEGTVIEGPDGEMVLRGGRWVKR